MVDVTPPALGSPPPLQLAANVARLPRELSSQEVRALWDAGSPDARLVIAGLLGGLAIEELSGLRYEDIDFDGGRIQTPGPATRSLVLREPLRQLLKERQAAQGGGATLADTQGNALSTADLEGLIVCAACDAGLAYSTEVNADLLRHTYLAYLVRQGARLADIGGMMGRIAPALVREYGRLSPPGPGLPLDQIDPVFPALR
jgi:integrase